MAQTNPVVKLVPAAHNGGVKNSNTAQWPRAKLRPVAQATIPCDPEWTEQLVADARRFALPAPLH
eukprot:CAMPEP_0172922232 /NCGR_PEP_ID=MMETSP1075-20121228/207417_1 /TAXON_ID=2916 /ORGANISM="Ceratium fusus, Strain PA161109" /LENGTH=64 /DNA_ID=CAMNT_0013782521 /DNA_START=357 /DNA_END=551 /DNA_ORIENTATION=+